MSLLPSVLSSHRFLGIALACSALFAGTAQAADVLRAVGVENEYANVISQIGGPYVQVQAIESNPNTDPHTFQASPAIAREVARAQLVVRNGLGYDSWAKKILVANPNRARKVIVVQDLLGLPENTPNPHLWYKPETMPKVAAAVADALSAMLPEHRTYFAAQVKKFDASLQPWYQGLAAFRKDYPKTPVAVTEPVADYMLEAAGCEIKTPWSLQAAIMNGTDPAPQDVSRQSELLGKRRVKVFLYNQQVTSSLTQSFLAKAKQARIPVVGVYETMPAGYDYQRWMMAELNALRAAVVHGTSTMALH